MSAAVIADNTTRKNIVLPSGLITFPANVSVDIFQVPVGATYLISAVVFDNINTSGSGIYAYIKTPGGVQIEISGNLKNIALGDNHDNTNLSINPGAQIMLTPAGTFFNKLFFRNPLNLTAGYSFGFRIAGGGASNRNYALLGEATQNTP